MVVWEKGSDERSSLQCQKAATGTVVFVEEEEGRRNNLLSFLALNIFSTRWNSTPVSRLLNLFPTKYFCYLVGNVCMREPFFCRKSTYSSSAYFNIHVHLYHIPANMQPLIVLCRTHA